LRIILGRYINMEARTPLLVFEIISLKK